MAASEYFGSSADSVPKPMGCPVNHDFSPFSDRYRTDPYGTLALLRKNSPAFYASDPGYLVLTRMEDIVDVLRRSEDFSSENVQWPVQPICDAAAEILGVKEFNPLPVLSNRGDPTHSRIRKHVQASFSGRRMQILEPLIRERCGSLVSEMIAAGAPGEFSQSVGHRLPGETIYRLCGFPQSDDARLFDWSKDRLAFTWGQTNETKQISIAQSMVGYWKYCIAHVKMREENPEDDLTTELLEARSKHPDELSLDEISSVLYGLSFAGHEIVSYFLANSLINLLKNRDHWDALCEDRSKIPTAVEEVLRFDSPQTSWRRLALVDTEVAGVTVPAGTQIFLSLAAANHDPEKFNCSDTFDIQRENSHTHISFGRGAHFCLGNRLATIEAIILLETLSAQVPSLDLVREHEIKYISNFTLRGPEALWLKW